jgi:hypothetical protein
VLNITYGPLRTEIAGGLLRTKTTGVPIRSNISGGSLRRTVSGGHLRTNISGMPQRTDVLTLFNPIILPPAYSPALIYFGRKRGWWVTSNYPTVLKDKNLKQKQKEYILRYLLAKIRTT